MQQIIKTDTQEKEQFIIDKINSTFLGKFSVAEETDFYSATRRTVNDEFVIKWKVNPDDVEIRLPTPTPQKV